MKKVILGLVIGFSFWASSASASLYNPCNGPCISESVYNDLQIRYQQISADLQKVKDDALTATTNDKVKYTADLKIKDDKIASLAKDKEDLERKVVNLESNSQKLITEYELKVSDLNKSLDTAKNVVPTIIYKDKIVTVPAPVKKESTPVVSTPTPIQTEIIPASLVEIPVHKTFWQKITSWFK